MTAFSRLQSRVVPLGLDNVDTDQICPARFMKRRRQEGYGDAFLHDLRFEDDGTPRDNPVDAAEGAEILLVGRNFGGGSSREAAVYAILDAGFRVVIAESFGDIFAANAARNGLVPALVDGSAARSLLAVVQSNTAAEIHVDLHAKTVGAEEQIHSFVIDEARRTMLLNGWDDADVTAQFTNQVSAFVERDSVLRPWAQRVRQPDR